MRLLLLTPGTGHFYCGSCLRDGALAAALRQQGHEVTLAPLYLPLVLEESVPSTRVRLGGINVWLQQRSALARRLPRRLMDALDHPGLLRFVSRRGRMTEAPDLGALCLSMLQGENGHQAHELEKLVAWARTLERPDVVVLSNAMLAGVARRLRAALGCPIVATLQGEAAFLDALPGPFRARAWDELTRRAAEIDGLVAVSEAHAAVMRARLGLAAERVRVVHNGIDVAPFGAEPPPLAARRPPVIGYLARLCADKGLPVLVDAFLRLQQRGRVPGVRLRAAGAMLAEDRPLVRRLRRELRCAGGAADAEIVPNVTPAQKHALLRSLSVLSVPATYGESFGLYVLEALAAGVPVVQPRHGAFPEILAATGGGVLCAPDDPAALAAALEELLRDEPRAQQLADRGRRAVLERFTAARMAGAFADACASAVAGRARAVPGAGLG